MKKLFVFLIGILSICLGLTLSSCKKNNDDYVGFWVIEETKWVDEEKKFTLSELIQAVDDYEIEYYVDGYSSDNVISHLNNKVPYYFSATYTSELDLHYEVVDIFHGSEGYYLERYGVVSPNISTINPHTCVTMARTVKGRQCELRFYYDKDANSEE